MRKVVMGFKVKKMLYFTTLIENRIGSEAQILSMFSKGGVNYLAFNSVENDTKYIKFTLYPNEIDRLLKTAKENDFVLDGPHAALHIEGDDETGACAEVFERLSIVNVKSTYSFGIADINNSYGIVVYLNDKDCEKAMMALNA
jgi:hypothetical protein